jgi:hypothetical protein
VQANPGTDSSRLWVWGREKDVRAFEKQLRRMREDIEQEEKVSAFQEQVRRIKEQGEETLLRDSRGQGWW